MAFTSTVRTWWAAYRCTPGVRVPTGFFGRHPVYAANQDGITATQVLEQGHIESGYVPTAGGYIGSKRQCPAGIGGKTCQESGADCSIHNYCMAWDIEYQYNLYIRTSVEPEDFSEDWFPAVCKYTLSEVRAIEGIKNTTGEQMFRWLGWAIGDFMHWQINVPPTRMTVDWNTVPNQDVEEGDMEQFYQDMLDQWSAEDLDTMKTAGFWDGNTDYYKGESASPHPDDVKNLVLECLSSGAVYATYEDANALQRGDTVALS